MATNYPVSLDDHTVLKNDATDATLTLVTHETAHNNVADAIIAIETAIGVSPNGSYATVAAALLNAVFKTPATDQIVQPSADHIALIVKVGNSLYTSNIFEGRLANNTIVAYLDRFGNFSAQELLINGVALASTHLSDGATLAHLTSPAFTGTPTAPTAALSDSSTEIATTEFVKKAGVSNYARIVSFS